MFRSKPQGNYQFNSIAHNDFANGVCRIDVKSSLDIMKDIFIGCTLTQYFLVVCWDALFYV